MKVNDSALRRAGRIRIRDLPRFLLQVIVEMAGLFGGRLRRTEGSHVLVTDVIGRVLVVRTTYLGPGWMLPGGRVERSETPHEAAAREALEETGMKVAIDRLLVVDARRRTSVSFVFRGTLRGGTLSPQFGEIAEVGWLSRIEIARTSPDLSRLLEHLDAVGEGASYLGLGDA